MTGATRQASTPTVCLATAVGGGAATAFVVVATAVVVVVAYRCRRFASAVAGCQLGWGGTSRCRWAAVWMRDSGCSS